MVLLFQTMINKMNKWENSHGKVGRGDGLLPQYFLEITNIWLVFVIASFAGRARKRKFRWETQLNIVCLKISKLIDSIFTCRLWKINHRDKLFLCTHFVIAWGRPMCNTICGLSRREQVWKCPQKNADKLYKLHVDGALIHAYFWPEIWWCFFLAPF